MFVAWQPGGATGPLNRATPASFCFHFHPTCVYIIPAVYILWVSCYSGRLSWLMASSLGKSLHFYFIHFFTSFCDFLFDLLLIQSAEISLVSIQTYRLCSLPLHSNCRSHPDCFVFLRLCMAVHGFSLLPVWFVSWHFLLSLHFQLFMFHFGVQGIDFVSCISALGIISCLKHCRSLCLDPQLLGNLVGKKRKTKLNRNIHCFVGLFLCFAVIFSPNLNLFSLSNSSLF